MLSPNKARQYVKTATMLTEEDSFRSVQIAPLNPAKNSTTII
jgi:hypothetical protein